jgi:glutamate synthase domain-containing protein 3
VALRQLVERHLRFTGSERAAELLEHWGQARFVRIAPKAEVARASTEPALETEAVQAVAAR